MSSVILHLIQGLMIWRTSVRWPARSLRSHNLRYFPTPQRRWINIDQRQRENPREMAEHFDFVINRLSRAPMDETLDAIPTLEETRKAIRLISSGKHLAQMPSISGGEASSTLPAYMATRDSPTRFQRCFYCASLQAQRKSSGLWQP